MANTVWGPKLHCPINITQLSVYPRSPVLLTIFQVQQAYFSWQFQPQVALISQWFTCNRPSCTHIGSSNTRPLCHISRSSSKHCTQSKHIPANVSDIQITLHPCQCIQSSSCLLWRGISLQSHDKATRISQRSNYKSFMPHLSCNPQLLVYTTCFSFLAYVQPAFTSLSSSYHELPKQSCIWISTTVIQVWDTIK